MARSKTPKVEESAMDYREHERTYAGVMHLSKWAIIHVVLLVLALYVIVIAGNAVGGIVLLLISLVALTYGIVTTNGAAREVANDPELWHSSRGTGDAM